jgi:hypothetical protein
MKPLDAESALPLGADIRSRCTERRDGPIAAVIALQKCRYCVDRCGALKAFLASFAGRVGNDTASPAECDSSIRVFTRRRFKDRAGKLGIQSAGEHPFNCLTYAVVPELHPVRKFFRCAGRHATP